MQRYWCDQMNKNLVQLVSLKIQKTWLLLIAFCLSCFSFTANAGTPPTYPITTFVELCDDINSPENTEFQRFGNIFKGNQGWLISENLDLQIDHKALKQQEKHTLKRFAKLLKKRGIDLVILPIPPRGLVYQEQLQEVVADFDAKTLNSKFKELLQDIQPLGQVIDTFKLSVPPNNLFYKSSADWTPSGTKWFAEKTANLISYQGGKKSSLHAAVDNGQVSAGGAIRSYVASICGYALEPEYAAGLTIDNQAKQHQSTHKIALLGDRLAKQDKFQFANMLSVATSLDVVNYASTESSKRWGWLQLIDDIASQKVDVDTIVWQFQASKGLATNSLFRQLIPALNQGCAVDATATKSTFNIDLNASSTEVLVAKNAAGLSSTNMIAELTFKKFPVQSVALKLWFDNGSNRKVTLSKAFSRKGNALFYIDFASFNVPNNAKLLALEVDRVKLASGSGADTVNVGLKLCSGE